MSERKGIERNISVRAIVTVTIVVIFVLLVLVSIWFKDDLITAILGAVPILVAVYTWAQQYYEKNLSSTKTSISVENHGEWVVVTCNLKSFHPKRLLIDKAYLFIDSGQQTAEVCKFKHILCHGYGEESCEVEKKMTSNSIKCYNDINSDNKGFFYELPHLSSSTILYLDTHEEFSDECVLKLEKGVYRAMFVITFKNADCNCAIKHFALT